jgi:16S rRNA (cytidine1402-2'-O)-methyltransferase
MVGTLYLIPVPLGPTAPQDSLPANVLATVRPLTYFVVEQAKTARAFLKAAGTDTPCKNCSLKN